MKPVTLLSVKVQFEQDVVTARGRAKRLAHLLNLSPQVQTKFATAVSELARNALMYAGVEPSSFSLMFPTTGFTRVFTTVALVSLRSGPSWRGIMSHRLGWGSGWQAHAG
ncbi:hypothetical protein ACFSC4_27475 [Deinococcus malanensis]|uniref:hypothetical protein n=1 Tax=Deinococcus malanensis TaxID=1706855 RepID=UPI00362A58D9